jgi:hypothetical protein
MGTTSTYGFPYPDGPDDADMAQATEDLAQAIDTELFNRATRFGVQRFTTAGGHTYTPSSNIKGVWVEIVGGGGAGGGCAATGAGQVSTTAGGQGGAYAKFYLPRSAWSTTVAVTVGAGGTGASGLAGGNGGNTSFGAFGTAPGGQGGGTMAAGSTYSASVGGDSAQAFSGSATDVLFIPGSEGLNSVRFSASLGYVGTGGGSHLVGRVRATNDTTGTGSTGRTPGGGGCGAYNRASQAVDVGGDGGAGICIVTEVY